MDTSYAFYGNSQPDSTIANHGSANCREKLGQIICYSQEMWVNPPPKALITRMRLAVRHMLGEAPRQESAIMKIRQIISMIEPNQEGDRGASERSA
jgi:hypothetical protein